MSQLILGIIDFDLQFHFDFKTYYSNKLIDLYSGIKIKYWCSVSQSPWKLLSFYRTKDQFGLIFQILNMNISDIGKSTGPRSSTGENSGGPIKTLIVPVLLSSKKNSKFLMPDPKTWFTGIL